MKVLVTGGAGFIGSHIVDRLIENGFRVSIVDNLSTGQLQHINKNASFYNQDIRRNNLYEIFKRERPEYVIHHAAQIDVVKSLVDPVYDADVNILGTINILECCKDTGVKKIIFASSAAIYGNPQYLGIDENHPVKPVSYYGVSKYSCEQYIRVYQELYGLKYSILRYSNVYGNRQDVKGEGGVVSKFVDSILTGKEPVIYGDGEQTRDFVYVDDVVDANLLALNNGDNDVFNIGTGNEVSVNELWHILNRLTENDLKPERSSARKGDIRNSYFNNTKAKKILGWQPKYSLTEGLRKMISDSNAESAAIKD